MDKKKKEEIALFRYGIIAPVIHENVASQNSYFKDVCQKELNVPHIGKKRYRVSGLKSWLAKYKNGNIKALEPKVRLDKGVSRKIDDEAAIEIRKIIDEYPHLSCSGVFRLLFVSGHTRLDITEQTVRKYIKDNDLMNIKSGPVPRKKFEKRHVNELWITDFMHGPHIIEKNKKRKIFLCCIIDDHSRVITAGRFFYHENSISLEVVLKEAILRFGLPKVLYCDNGSAYISSHLQLACARLGISLVHSKPYDSPSRGKIERFWRTVRGKFLSTVNLKEISCLDDINRLFDLWLTREYNQAYHSGIDAKPMDKYIASAGSTNINRVNSLVLDKAFLMTLKRKVKNDSTISVNSKLLEVPTKYIGTKIEIRYAHDKPDEPVIYENDEPVEKLKLVNVNENSDLPLAGIRFSHMEEE